MLFFVFLAIYHFVVATSFEKKSMIMKRSEYGDQKVSESGYRGYTIQSNGYDPTKYSSYILDNGILRNIPAFGYLGADQTIGNPSVFQAGSPYTYFDDGSSYSKSYYNNHLPVYHQRLYMKPRTPEVYNLPLIKNTLYKNSLHPVKYGYANLDGRTSDEVKIVADGYNGVKGYKNQQDYDDAAQGKHLEDTKQEEYDEKSGKKENKEENSGYNSESAEAEKGVRGSTFAESNGHRKGSKTTGFHKVYHKDEYKKDHSFYDEKDSSGHHDKYDKNGAKYEKESGKFEAGKQGESAHREVDYGLKDSKDQRKYLSEIDGRRREEGNSLQYGDNKKFSEKEEKHYQDDNGYVVSDDE